MSLAVERFALASGPLMDWVGRAGKLLLMVAGLAVLLDLIGAERLARWADTAATRRRLARQRLRQLRMARPLLRLVDQMERSVPHEGELASSWFTAQEFAGFTRRVRRELHTRSRLNEAPSEGFVKDQVLRFLTPRLGPDEQVALAESARPVSRARNKLGQFSLFVPILMPIVILDIYGQLPFGFGWLFVAILMAVTVGLFLLQSMMVALFTGTLLAILLASLGWGLARGTLILIGPDKAGHPMRWAALTLFFVGSLLDLIVSW